MFVSSPHTDGRIRDVLKTDGQKNTRRAPGLVAGVQPPPGCTQASAGFPGNEGSSPVTGHTLCKESLKDPARLSAQDPARRLPRSFSGS